MGGGEWRKDDQAPITVKCQALSAVIWDSRAVLGLLGQPDISDGHVHPDPGSGGTAEEKKAAKALPVAQVPSVQENESRIRNTGSTR